GRPVGGTVGARLRAKGFATRVAPTGRPVGGTVGARLRAKGFATRVAPTGRPGRFPRMGSEPFLVLRVGMGMSRHPTKLSRPPALSFRPKGEICSPGGTGDFSLRSK